MEKVTICSALTLLLVLATPVLAQGGGGSGGGGAASSAGVVIKALGLLTTWINGKDDNCAVAALAAAWGPQCGLKKDECTDTGFYYASCDVEASNGCGYAYGIGFASESPAGMWAGYDTDAYAGAVAFGATEGKNGARGWGKASVDGTSRAKTRGSGSDGFHSGLPGGSPGGSGLPLKAGWPEGTVLAVLNISNLSLDTQTGTQTHSTYNGFFQVDGQTVWSAGATLDPQGNLSVSGSLSPSDFSVGYDASTGMWNASLSNYRFEHYVGWLDPNGVRWNGLETKSATLDVHVHYEAEAETDDEAGGAVASTHVSLFDATLVDQNGEPVHQGQTVTIAEPLVVLSDAAQLGRYLDTDGGSGGLGIGILDLLQPPSLFAGDRLEGLTGTVYHDDGRLVLVDVDADVIPAGGLLPPAQSLTVAEVQAQAEELEGTLVRLQGLELVDPAQWPTSQRSATVDVLDGQGDAFQLAIPLASGIGGTPAPAGPFDAVGILTQDDPEAPFFEGYQLRLRSPEDVGLAVQVPDQQPIQKR